MKSQVLLSIFSLTSLVGVVAAQQDPAADVHVERALERDGHRRHHARSTTTTPTATLALSRRPAATTTSKAATSTSKISTTSKAATSAVKPNTSVVSKAATSTAKVTSTSSKAATSTSKTSTTTIKASSTSTTIKAASTTTSKITTVSSSSTPLAPAPTSGTTFLNVKKGVSYNTINNTAPFAGSAGWAYDWYSEPSGTGLPTSMEFAPMLWSNNPSLTGIWDTNVKAAMNKGITHLLGFNEPDLSSQSNMTPDQAVAAWKTYMEPYAGQMKLIAPAITNGGAPSGVAWMTDFLSKCTGCHIDAIAMHWYDAAWNTGYFTNYFTDAINTFSPLPIWITEFQGSGTAAQQVTFINTVVPWMNNNAGIERYAIFGNFDGSADAGNMITGGQLNSVGIAYRDAK